MSAAKKRKRPAKPRHVRKPKAADAEAAEVLALEQAIRAGQPAPGSNALLSNGSEPGSYSGVADFDELPLSRHTKGALAKHGYVHLTAVQRAALPHALCGRDILGAAKTGSGKTLCFLIPVRMRTSLNCVILSASAYQWQPPMSRHYAARGTSAACV